MARKKVDPKAKQRKQLIILGGLLLFTIPLFVMFTLPALTGGGGSSAPKINTVGAVGTPPPGSTAEAPAAPTTMAPPTLAGATPTAGVAQPVAAVAGGDGIPETDPSVTPAGGQLVTFDLFETKDPFAAQVGGPKPEQEAAAPVAVDAGAAARADGASAPGSAAPAKAPTTPTFDTGAPAQPATPAPTPSAAPAPAATPAPAPATVTTAKITVNGVTENVPVNGTFPKDESVFRVVSVAAGSIRIAIVGGSYQTGARTVKLTKGEPLTLMNTADGTRFELELLSVS